MSTTVNIPIVAEHTEAILGVGEADGVTFWEQHPDNGYLYGVTFVAGDVPAQLLKVNKNDFTDRSVVDFANDGVHTKVKGIVYADSTDRFYVLFGGDDYTITEVHPVTLARTDKATKVGATALIDGLATDDSSLYVLSQSGGSQIAAYNLSTFAETIADISAYATGTALKHFNGHLYAVQISPDYKLLKITFSPLAVVATPFPDTPGAVNQQDFLALNGQYMLAVLQDTGRVWQFDLATLAATSIAVPLSGSHIRLIYDGEAFWDLFDSGIAVHITPGTMQQESYSLTTGYLSGLVGDANYLYGVNDGSPTTVARYRITPYGSFRWVVLPASLQNDYGLATAIDPSGNIIFGGSMSGGPFIQVNKYSASGALIWEKQYSPGAVYGLATDSAGNIYAVGACLGAANFGGDTLPLPSAGFSDIFVLKLRASDGYALWAKGFVGALVDSGQAIVVDGDGNVLTIGSFSVSSNFGGGERIAKGGTDIFVVKLSGDGDWIWDKTFGGADPGENESGFGIAVDASNNAYCVGSFIGPASFGGATFTTNGIDAFIVKLAAADGAHIWSRQMHGLPLAISYGVAVFGNGDAAVVGSFHGSVRLRDDGTVTSSTGRQDIFMARYAAANGAHVWSRTVGGSVMSDDICYSVAIGAADIMYVTGKILGGADFGAGLIGTGPSAFIARLNPSTGVAIWSKALSGQSQVVGRSIAANANGCVTTGWWYDYVDFGDGIVRRHVGQGDAFIEQLTA